jgi:hypothetical protein
MIMSHERSLKPFTALKGFLGWLCPIKVTYWHFFRSRKVNLKTGLIPEDDLLGMAKSWEMTYRDWPISACDKPEFPKKI